MSESPTAAPWSVRAAVPSDAAETARVHAACWRETYRGTMPDAVLDDPELGARTERMWTAVTGAPAGAQRRAAVAVAVAVARDGIIGLALAGPARDEDATWPHELFVLYLLAAHHGSGAGSALLDAVLDPGPAALWVADPNPRAQAFYRKRGFAPDGAETFDDAWGVREIRMRRGAPAAD